MAKTGDGTIYAEKIRDEQQIKRLCFHILPNHLVRFLEVAEMRGENIVLKIQLFKRRRK